MFVINYLKFLHFHYNYTFFGSIEVWTLLEDFKIPRQILRNKTMDELEKAFLLTFCRFPPVKLACIFT